MEDYESCSNVTETDSPVKKEPVFILCDTLQESPSRVKEEAISDEDNEGQEDPLDLLEEMGDKNDENILGPIHCKAEAEEDPLNIEKEQENKEGEMDVGFIIAVKDELATQDVSEEFKDEIIGDFEAVQDSLKEEVIDLDFKLEDKVISSSDSKKRESPNYGGQRKRKYAKRRTSHLKLYKEKEIRNPCDKCEYVATTSSSLKRHKEMV